MEDIPSTLPEDSSEKLGNKLEKAWFKELENSKIGKRNPSLMKTIFRVFRKEFFQIALLHSFNEFFVSISRQVLLGYFLIYLRNTENDPAFFERLDVIGITLILSYALNQLLTNHFMSKAFHLGCKIKIALSAVMYRKCLQLGNNAEGDASTGRIINLMSNDLAKFDNVILYGSCLYSSVISVLIISVLISNKVGLYGTIVCLILVILPSPIQIIISKSTASFRMKIGKAADERIRIMDEIICGIQVIKMYAWEKPYEKFLIYKRNVEMKLIGKVLYLKDLRATINTIFSKFSLYAIVVVYSLNGGSVVPEVVFVVLGYCCILSKVIGLFCLSFGLFAECLVSTKRIQNFLELNEFKKLQINVNKENKKAIEFRNVRCAWYLDSNQDTLKNITLDIEANKLTAIIGQVGSGKSSLLNAILGELPINEGSMKLNGSVSYYSQIPWIFAGTIRKNIIFCGEYEAERYKKVVEACALVHDFALLPDADLTLVGERGVTLSGGQKARIALARTVYKMADIYLLDDPLSAVDTHVSKQIFQNCILDLLKNKTCILVSHQLQFLSRCDKVVSLKEGKMIFQGTFDQLLESDPTFANIIKNKPDNENDSCESQQVNKNIRSSTTSLKFALDDDDEDIVRGEYEKLNDCDYNTQKTSDQSNQQDELEKEDNEITDSYALLKFVKRGIGVPGIIFMSSLFILTQIFMSSCDIWLAYWTSTETETFSHDMNTTVEGERSKFWYYFSIEMSARGYFIAGYTTILMGVVIAAPLRDLMFARFGLKCSKKIHNDAFHSVLHTHLSFFHNNPSGRILNRFSKDLGIIDEFLVPLLLDVLFAFMQVLASFVVSASISVVYIVPVAIIVVLLIVIRNYYIRVTVNLKRLENIAKSPVFVHVHSTLQGLPVIRASSVNDKWAREFDLQQDVYSSAWYLYIMTSVGYSYYLEVICFLYLVAILVGSFFLNLTASQIGLALAQLIFLLDSVFWAMKFSGVISDQTVSIDRLLRYSGLEAEKQPIEDKSANDWPSNGKIIFDNVNFRHNVSSEPAIRNVSFIVEPEEKIGIVGRTGAGKTSLLAALFRLGYIDGSITIDDVDTSFVRLENLRAKISVIPQDPILFSGSLRRNLDPFEEYNDDTLWKALEDAQLKKVIADADENMGLDMTITEGGKNFSVGQRQLICLARAIIRNNKILILDEATASVDLQTDDLIRKIIKDKLKSRTILTIAHRLNTVLDSDKILVMDCGTIVEYGHPYQLLKNEEGVFYKLVSETSDLVAETFINTAKQNYFNNEKQKINQI